MSLVHDALRRGARPARETAKPGRPPHTDTVLAALGYQARKPRVTPGAVAIVAVILFAAALGAWLMWG